MHRNGFIHRQKLKSAFLSAVKMQKRGILDFNFPENSLSLHFRDESGFQAFMYFMEWMWCQSFLSMKFVVMVTARWANHFTGNSKAIGSVPAQSAELSLLLNDYFKYWKN